MTDEVNNELGGAGSSGGMGAGERRGEANSGALGRGRKTGGGTCLCIGAGTNQGAFLNKLALFDENMLLEEGMKSMVTMEVVLEDVQGKYAGVVNTTFSISVCPSDEKE